MALMLLPRQAALFDSSGGLYFADSVMFSVSLHVKGNTRWHIGMAVLLLAPTLEASFSKGGFWIP